MFLDTVNPEKLNGTNTAERLAVLPHAKWEHFPHSTICHHGTACCETAREWFLAMDFSQLNGGSIYTGPRWIRARYEWGPSAHPIHWCEAVKRKTLDCGALAAMAQECFTARGVRAFPAQLIQKYSTDATDHWGHKWNEDEVSQHWINGDTIYHEGCAVLAEDGTLRLWDASAAWWVNSVPTSGYGSLVALKIIAPATAGTQLRWGQHTVLPGEWQAI